MSQDESFGYFFFEIFIGIYDEGICFSECLIFFEKIILFFVEIFIDIEIDVFQFHILFLPGFSFIEFYRTIGYIPKSDCDSQWYALKLVFIEFPSWTSIIIFIQFPSQIDGSGEIFGRERQGSRLKSFYEWLDILLDLGQFFLGLEDRNNDDVQGSQCGRYNKSCVIGVRHDEASD
jgi:hypothetical protein